MVDGVGELGAAGVPRVTVVTVWTKQYEHPIPYGDWYRLAAAGQEPPFGLISHSVEEVPWIGQGDGQVLAASDNLVVLAGLLDGRATGSRVFKIEDARNPNFNIAAELRALR